MHETDDLYGILQIHPSANPDEIKAAYRRLARKYHPDVNKSPESEEIMKRLNHAYEVLSHPAQRMGYDHQSGAGGPTKTKSPGYAQPSKEWLESLNVYGPKGT